MKYEVLKHEQAFFTSRTGVLLGKIGLLKPVSRFDSFKPKARYGCKKSLLCGHVKFIISIEQRTCNKKQNIFIIKC